MPVIPFRIYMILAASVAFVGFAWWAVHAIRDNAVQAERARIERANSAARDAADAAMRGPLECAGTWNRELGKCER